MVGNMSPYDLELNVVILKQIWSRRNILVFEGKFDSPCTVLQKAKMLLENFQTSQLSDVPTMSKLTTNQENQTNSWQPSGVNHPKANWDAVVDNKQQSTEIGRIIRNNKGAVHASSCCNRPIKHQPATAEALALREAMTICNDLNQTRVSLEGDCKEVVNAVNSKEISFSAMSYNL